MDALLAVHHYEQPVIFLREDWASRASYNPTSDNPNRWVEQRPWTTGTGFAMNRLTNGQIDFLTAQPLFFVATAAPTGRINVSPKGMDTLRVLDERRIVWLNLTGSGNETAAHVAANSRMTLMFMSISEKPLILRVYGTARAVHPRDDDWDDLISLFPTLGGSRQIFDVAVDKTTSSCGSGVPIMTVDAIRGDEELEPFYAAMTDEELTAYWDRKNTVSIDGYPTGIFAG